MLKVRDYIPNPFDKNSTLAGLEKKGELLSKGSSSLVILNNIIGLVFIGMLLKASLGSISVNVIPSICILAAFNIIRGIYVFQEIKIIKALSSSQDGFSYKNIVIKTTQLALIEKLITLFSWVLILLVNLISYPNIFDTPVSLTIPIKITFGLILYLTAAFDLFSCIEVYFYLTFMKKVQVVADFAETYKRYVLLDEKFKMITFYPAFYTLLTVFVVIGIPYIVVLPFFLFSFLLIFLDIVQINNLNNLRYSSDSQPISAPLPNFLRKIGEDRRMEETKNLKEISVYEDESILGVIYGILRSAATFKEGIIPTGFGSLGVGVNINKENTLVLTNHRLLLIQVPVTGGNTSIIGSGGDIDFTTMGIMYNRKEIREKGEIFIQNTTLEKLRSEAIHDLPFENIKSFKLNNYILYIEMANEYKFKYVFFDKEYIQYLTDIIQKTPSLSVISK